MEAESRIWLRNTALKSISNDQIISQRGCKSYPFFFQITWAGTFFQRGLDYIQVCVFIAYPTMPRGTPSDLGIFLPLNTYDTQNF